MPSPAPPRHDRFPRFRLQWRGCVPRAPYQHVAAELKLRADVYRVETFIPFSQPTPLHRDVYYVPGERLDAFFEGWGEHATTVVDIRQLTLAAALAELEQFRQAAAGAKKDA